MKFQKERLSVCHLISGDLWAGAEVMAYHLISALNEYAGVSVSVIVFNHGRLADELRNKGVDVVVIDESKYLFPVLVCKVARLLFRKKIDILHSHRQKENVIALLVSFCLKGTKRIATVHGMPERFNRSISINSIKTQLNFYFLSHFFSCSAVVSEEILNIFVNKKRFPLQRVIAIHNGIPLDVSSEKKNCYDKKKLFIIGSSGRLVTVKDFGLFISIANVFCNQKNIRFVLAGDGPLKLELQKTVADLGLNNFTLLGHIDDVNSFYNKIDLFVNTSIHEGIPMTILEAMSRGIPVVAPNVGGIPEIICNGVEGFLIDKRDAQEYSHACNALYENQRLYESMSKASLKKIENCFSVSTMVERYLNTYKCQLNSAESTNFGI